jgi:hypothetical protein
MAGGFVGDAAAASKRSGKSKRAFRAAFTVAEMIVPIPKLVCHEGLSLCIRRLQTVVSPEANA